MNREDHRSETAGRAAARDAQEFRDPFELSTPDELTSALVFSSPHSGDFYPKSFLAQTRLDAFTLRRSEDACADRLFRCAEALGAPMLRAAYPRAYLDLNREPYELDPRMFSEPLPDYANTRSLRVAAGLGTLPRVVSDAREIYAHKLPVAEALERVERIYRPYHAALAALMEQAVATFGVAVLVDCHSMPRLVTHDPKLGPKSEKRGVDFVIGDRFGSSCDPRLVDIVVSRLVGFSYVVQRNRPYAGGFITEHYGKPAVGRHAMQIEVSRDLYVDEATLTPNARFAVVAEHIGAALADLAQELRRREAAQPSRFAAE
ncbi:MAG TPA: N-formylglutamate amidohydrolase [Methylocystis sp.]|nr:N-formylglutamate amidohydrolase [Methylocystis sp.]